MTSIVNMRRAVVTMVTAVAVALGMMASPSAATAQDNRHWLRPDATGTCEWDPHVAYWIQRCDVYSPAMGRNIPVQVQPASRGGNAGLYLLDGLRANNQQNGWNREGNAHKLFAEDNITLVMPVGGEASFYADWQGTPKYFPGEEDGSYKWETFLTAELPGYLQQHFGVAPNNNSVAGLSMGATAAMNLAGKHPNQFRQALSYSGYLFTTAPGMQTMMRVALLDAGGYNINAMYGTLINPARFQNDPFYLVGNLRNTDVYVSAASGVPGPPDQNLRPEHKAPGIALEFMSMIGTRTFEANARLNGVPITTDYPAQGLHNWYQFNYQLERTRDRILDVMGVR